MIKKILFLTISLIFSYNISAQTIVGTQPENKKAILEILTGIHCGYCPQAQSIAQNILNNNSNDFFWINIHTGSFSTPTASEPDFRTSFGNNINNFAFANASSIGYPAGMVNRHSFPQLSMGGADFAMGRGSFPSAANQIISESSYVNIGVEADLDIQTRELTVHVEAYYTGDSPLNTNKLNIALLQNNTLGPQSGGGMGNEYVHQRRLVHLITGQWGEDIATTTTGSFIDKTYTYTVPTDYNNIKAELSDLQIVAFIAESQSEIISGDWTNPNYSSIYTNDVAIEEVEDINNQCNNIISPKFKIKNLGENDLTSLDITYNINNGNDQIYNWSGSLSTAEYEFIEIPNINYNLQANNIIEISLNSDEVSSNNTATINFDKAIESISSLTLKIKTDQYGNECTWEIIDSSGNVAESGGPYSNNSTEEVSLTLPQDCYSFRLYDSYGDGGGPVSLIDEYGTTIYQTNGDYNSGSIENFSTNGVLKTNIENSINISFYPNPSPGIINFKTLDPLKIEITTLQGKTILSRDQIRNDESLDLSSLQKGIYFIKMSGNNVSKTEKLILN